MVTLAVILAGASLYLNPQATVHRYVDAYPELSAIAEQPAARWFGDWNNDIETAVDEYVTAARLQDELPVLVLYNIPNRDCGSYSSGGAEPTEYLDWIDGVVAGIKQRKGAVIIEPDALASDCIYETSVELIAEAVSRLATNNKTAIYIDAGHPNWQSVETMRGRLRAANIKEADGFALNVSNFYKTKRNLKYGRKLSKLLNDKHFVIDTSRNGNGSNAGEWCNPSGRALGRLPTTNTGHGRADAYLWIKAPGESDGTCNGGPAAGEWWNTYALELIHNRSN